MTHAPLRSRRERLIQTLWFEALGLIVVSPLFALVSGTGATEALTVLVALSLVVTCWAAIYNTLFDLVEWRCAARVASDRPARWRLLHTLGLECSAVIVTWPVVMALTPLTWLEALAADLGLTLAYVAYGYAFHIVFDRLRPVQAEPRSH